MNPVTRTQTATADEESGVQADERGAEVAQKPTFWRRWGGFLTFALLIGLFAPFTDNAFVLHVIIMSCLWAGAGSSWNILAGFGGQLSFGHAAFFGTGAYTMSILLVMFGVSPWFGLIAAGAAGGLLAAIVGIPAFRLRGPYFALATLALAEATRILIVYWRSVTGGNSGLLLPTDQGLAALYWVNRLPFVYVMIGYMTIAYGVSLWTRHSRFGYFLLAVREDEDAATVSGVNPTLVKTAAAMISGCLAGVGGALLARYVSIAEPVQFLQPFVSVQFLIVVIVGGLGTVAGPIVGGFVVVILGETLRSTVGSSFAGGLHLWVYGLLFLLIIMLLPQGLGPGIGGLVSSRLRRSRELPQLPDWSRTARQRGEDRSPEQDQQPTNEG